MKQPFFFFQTQLSTCLPNFTKRAAGNKLQILRNPSCYAASWHTFKTTKAVTSLLVYFRDLHTLRGNSGLALASLKKHCCFYFDSSHVLNSFHDLHFSRDIIRVTNWSRTRGSWHVPRMGGRRELHTGFWRVDKWKRPLGRSTRRWEDNIKINLLRSEVERRGLDWFDSGQGQMASACECGDEHSGFLKCGEFIDLGPVRFSGRFLLLGVS